MSEKKVYPTRLAFGSKSLILIVLWLKSNPSLWFSNMNTSSQQTRHTPRSENPDKKLPQLKGIRKRKWGKWVSEVRIPNSRAKFWLGSYATAEQAARAFDAAVYCLRGPNAARFNFPNSIPAIPSASSLSRQQIKAAAAKYALGEIPSTRQNINDTLTEAAGTPSRSSYTTETEPLCDFQLIFEELDFELPESLFQDSGGHQCLNNQKFPSLDAMTLELPSPPG